MGEKQSESARYLLFAYFPHSDSAWLVQQAVAEVSGPPGIADIGQNHFR